MSEKKRVRVFRPKVNTDHFANYIFELGGATGPGAMPMMQQPQDISKDIADILQMYAQSKGLDEQQLQQMFAAIMQMEPDQQQQAIAQMQQELGSSMAGNPMMAKKGGYIKETKKLLSKKIGGVSPNITSDSIVNQNNEYVANLAAKRVIDNVANEAAEDELSKADNLLGKASQNFAMQSMQPPTMDYGGYVNDMYNMGMGYASGEDNPFISDVLDTRMDFRNSLSALGNQFLKTRMKPGKTTIRKSGDIFNKQQMPENPAQVSTDVPTGKYGGAMNTFQPGGNTWTVEGINTSLDDLNIRDEDYHAARKAYEQGTHTPEQLDIMNRVEDYAVKYGNRSTGLTTTNETTNTGTNTGTGINGWQGGFYWQNGVPVTSVWDQNAGQGMTGQRGNDWTSIFQSPDRKMRINNNLLSMASNPAMIKQFGQALTQFQPDNVYLSKAKGRINPFGAKVVLKWDYDENGRPVQKEVVEGEEDASGRRINYTAGDARRDARRSERLIRRSDANYEKFYGHKPEDSGFSSTSTGPAYSAAQPPLTPEQKKYMEESLTLPPSTNNSGSGTNTGTFGPLPNVGPRNEEFAYGGMPKARAGKMVMKQQFRPYGSDLAMLYAPFANAVAAGLNMQGLNEQEEMAHLPDFFMPSLPMGQGSMGTKPVGPFAGSDMRFNPMFGSTGNYADALYQNQPKYGIASNIGYQGFNRKNGGMFQEGGVADYQEGGVYDEITDEELTDIFRRGGKVQYF